MQVIATHISNYLLENGFFPGTNSHCVSISYDPQTTALTVTSDVPGLVLDDEELTMELTTEHPSLYHFLYEYIITQIDDINAITPGVMFRRYQVGRATLTCFIDANFESGISFTWKEGVLLATDTAGETHEVPPAFMTPADLLVYTQNYYELKWL